MEESTDTAALARWARIALVAILALLTIRAFGDEYGRVPLLGDVDLAIHEFGHMLFQPFGIQFAGETMVILGGSLTQVALPLVFAAHFFRAREDHPPDLYAGLICLWWAALNLLDVAVYIADSRAGELMMLTGETANDGSPHDWRILLSQWGVLSRDTLYASWLRALATIVASVSLLFAAWIAWRAERTRRETGI